VTIADSTAGSTIYYTTNGTTPTTSSAVYAGAITISSTETLEAIATASSHSTSALATAVYTINLPPTATPAFSPLAGSYASAQSVTIADSTAGSTIYYTTNGTTPTTSSTRYTGAITVSSTETVEAIATASVHSTSAEATATYTIGMPIGSFTIAGTAVTVAAGAASGNASIVTITPSGGFTGSVALTAAITASPIGATGAPTLGFGASSPAQVTGGNVATANLTIFTIAAGSAALAYPANPEGSGKIFGGATLACLLLICVPARRRSRTLLGMVALLAILASGAAACGSSVTRSAVFTPINPGTTHGAYTVTVTGTSGATTETGTFTLTVQ
jgi:hypothetical protein